mmetsp:Transcript_6267/g.16162  ORF Transcript_6267/g.16162 Transcript_6267/m.16162 type:complete len:291 (-) Transcript_6267:337-1209(-)
MDSIIEFRAAVGDEDIRDLEHLQLGAPPAHDEVPRNLDAIERLWVLADGGQHHDVLVLVAEGLCESSPEGPAKGLAGAPLVDEQLGPLREIPQHSSRHRAKACVNDRLPIFLVLFQRLMREGLVDCLVLALGARVQGADPALLLGDQHGSDVDAVLIHVAVDLAHALWHLRIKLLDSRADGEAVQVVVAGWHVVGEEIEPVLVDEVLVAGAGGLALARLLHRLRRGLVITHCDWVHVEGGQREVRHGRHLKKVRRHGGQNVHGVVHDHVGRVVLERLQHLWEVLWQFILV